MVSTLKVTKIQIPNSDSDVISLDASTGNVTLNKTLGGTSITVQGENTNTTNLQQGLCKVWVSYFQGDNDTAEILDSFNVSSQTDNSQGRTTTNFNNDFANDDYSFVGQVFDGGGANDIRIVNQDFGTDTYTSAAIKYYCLDQNSNVNDAQRFFAQITGDLA